MRLFLTPEYYKDFACKCERCRETCCRGWGITISMAEYFHLLGVPCSEALRRRIDGAFHAVDHPDAGRYAMVSPNWRGSCALQSEEGLCALHGELGAAVLPSICRLYPRSPRTGLDDECSCSGSCERTIELLFAAEEPLRFEWRALDIEIPADQLRPLRASAALYPRIRDRAIAILQMRDRPISERMMLLGRAMRALLTLDRAGDIKGMAHLLDAYEKEPAPHIAQAPYGSGITEAIHLVAEVFCKNSESLSSRWAAGERALERTDYASMRRQFEEKYPLWQRYFEQITVNHLFFTRFPFSDAQQDFWGEYMALCAAHCVIMYIATICTFDLAGIEPLVDAVAAAFRMIEHSDFDRRGAILCARMGIDAQERLDELLCAL